MKPWSRPLYGQAIDELTPHLEARKQRVEVDIDAELGAIEADSSKIMDILINLLANAIKFTPDNGTIRVLAQKLEANPEWVHVVIHDEGVGITPASNKSCSEPLLHGFRYVSSLLGRIPVRQAGNRLGTVPGQDFRRVAWGTGRGSKHSRSVARGGRLPPPSSALFVHARDRRQTQRSRVSRRVAGDHSIGRPSRSGARSVGTSVPGD